MSAPSVPDPEPRTEPGDGAEGPAAPSVRPHTVVDDDLPHRRQEIRAMAAMFGLVE